VDPATCLEQAGRSGDWGEKALCYLAMAKARDPSLRLADDRAAASGMWYVPTYYGKTFHPVCIVSYVLSLLSLYLMC